MEVNSIQTGQQFNNASQQQQARQVDAQTQSPVVKEADVASSAALQAYKQQSQPKSESVVDTVQIKSSSVAKNLDTVRSIEQMHGRLNELIKGVRQTNEDLNKAVETVAQMQGSLTSIVKNYPPYPIDSMERRDLLMSYMSLRKEIENLMVPAPPQPVYEKVKSMWEAMFAQNGQMQASAVPALETGASDKKVQLASEGLDNLSEQLGGLSDKITQTLINS
ncbi:MAG: hypothetical protein OEL57_15005 [Trichlorobacter sp.]|uniref:hypothetical protein n=1 Tax=Trichlorobacter sp. TaxID=2911007 RepID=UPI002564E924|nr:hypothetical protein [Trichlorobacter sp.]MDK9719192.1 hypothetical protein [Trichlorobacter sp.]